MTSTYLQLKDDVDASLLTEEFWAGVWKIRDVYRALHYPCIVTSFRDSAHMEGSLHPKGRAGDFRTKHVSRTDLVPLVELVKLALGPDWDVVLERVDQTGEHLHTEYQPKMKGGDV